MQHIRLKTFDTDTEVIGALFLGWQGSLHRDRFETLLYVHDLESIDPETWYPIRKLLDFLTDVEEHGDFLDLVAIGKAIGETFEIPEEYTIDTYLMDVSAFYAAPYRGETPGHIKPERLAERHICLHFYTPWPHDYWYGTFYALMQQLNKEAIIVQTVIDPIRMTLDITW